MCFRSTAVVNTKLFQAQDQLSVPAVGSHWPSRPSLLLLCKSAILTGALHAPACPLSQLVTSSSFESWRMGANPCHDPLFSFTSLRGACRPSSSHHTWQQPGMSSSQVSRCTLLLISGNNCSFSLWSQNLLQLQQWPLLQKSPRPLNSFRGVTSWRDTVDCCLISASRPLMPWVMKTDGISANTSRVSCGRAFYRLIIPVKLLLLQY